MKKLFYLLMVLSISLFLAACGTEKGTDISSDTSIGTSSARVTAQSIISKMEGANYIEGELLVKFKSGVTTTSPLKSHRAIGASVKKRFTTMPNLEHVVLPMGVSVKNAIVQYMSDPNVEYAEPNYMRHVLEIIPNDQHFFDQWSLRNTGQYAAGTFGADIKATLAWDIAVGSSNTIIAVLDTGIDYNHVDLVGNMWKNPGEDCTNGIDDDSNGYIDDCNGWNFTTCETYDIIDEETGDVTCVIPKTEDNDPMDDYGHGTHVSGTIGAKGNNGIGIAGVAWNVQLMPVKTINSQGLLTTSDEVAAINYIVLMKNMGFDIKVINASFGGNTYSETEQIAVEAANTAGILFVAAAGNGGADGVGDNNDLMPIYPASYPLSNIISVAATDQNDRRASFSNFGLITVHVGAPGVYILSTVPGNSYSSVNEEFAMGTSMAAPHVSGLAGLLYNYYYYFSPAQIRGTILRYVDLLPTLSGWIQRAGRINAYLAVSSLLTPTELAATVLSSSEISLAWLNNATGEDGYKLERKTSGGTYTQITVLPADSTMYTDSSLIDGTLYLYRVRAYNVLPYPPTVPGEIEANSLYSNEATGVTPLNPPTGLIATTLSSSEVSLSWTDNSQTEEGYRIERSSSDFVQIATVGPNVTSYSDTGLNPSTTYIYRVSAYNTAAGGSQYSNEASATTFTPSGEPTPPPRTNGGGCSIGAQQNTPTAVADLAVMLIPLLYIAILRRRK